MRYAMIMAGGAGKRLWPLSRASRPKQLLRLVQNQSLLEIAVERLKGLFDNENIFIITSAEYADQVREALPQLPPGNVVGEPCGRDTANAIALATHLLEGDPDATMAVFTADHIIRPAEQFAQAVRKACRAAEDNPDALVTFGVRPNWPHTGLGYIHSGQAVDDGVYEVQGFREKPDHATARRYVESGEYFWNSGMFVWRGATIRAALEEHLPESMKHLKPVGHAVCEGRDYCELLKEIYPKLEKISIDYAVMEKARRVMMVELDCQWLDVGSWPALSDVEPADENGNAVVAPHAVMMDSNRNIVVSADDHLLALLGMDDCIVVHAPDATLVCGKSDAQRLKDLVEVLEQRFGKKYL